MDNKKHGLNSNNRNLIVILIAFVLLIWGPIESYGIVVRITYLIVIPVLVWIILNYLGKFWNVGELENNRIKRFIIGIIAVGLFIEAYSYYTADYHSECTQSVQTRDGSECIGDYVTADGPDKGIAIVLALFGAATIWYAIVDYKKEG